MTKGLIFICTILLAPTAIAEHFCVDNIPASTPDSRFTVNGDEVTDNETGLIWQRCSLGQTGQTGSDFCYGRFNTYTWQEALQAAEVEREVTGKGWRLPNIKELRSIVEEKCYDPAINLTIFPNTPDGNDYYWSASIVVNQPSSCPSARFIGIVDGSASYWSYGCGAPSAVRLVRDSQ